MYVSDDYIIKKDSHKLQLHVHSTFELISWQQYL